MIAELTRWAEAIADDDDGARGRAGGRGHGVLRGRGPDVDDAHGGVHARRKRARRDGGGEDVLRARPAADARSSAASTARRSAAAPASRRSATSSWPRSRPSFGFTEVKLGILPAIDLAVRAREDRRLRRARAVPHRACASTRRAPRRSAWSTRWCRRTSWTQRVADYVKEILSAAPEAIATAKELLQEGRGARPCRTPSA